MFPSDDDGARRWKVQRSLLCNVVQRTAPLVKPELAVKKAQIVNIIRPKAATKYDGPFSTLLFLRWLNKIMVKESSKYILNNLFKSRTF